MANDISSNPMILDTQGSTNLWPAKLKVSHFAFSNYAAQASAVIIQGSDGKVKWSATGASDLEPVTSHKVGWITGLVPSTITDGKVEVYVE
jgi:hypothetical protein